MDNYSLRKAAEQALEALEWNYGTDLENIENCMAWLDKMNATIPALRQALAQRKTLAERLAATPVDETAKGEQEPVAWITDGGKGELGRRKTTEKDMPLYTAPPKRQWQGLTDEELSALWVEYHGDYCIADGRIRKYEKAIEQALKEKNT